MKDETRRRLRDLLEQVDALRAVAYDIADELEDAKQANAATFIVDRLDLVKTAIQDVENWPTTGTDKTPAQ